MNYKKFFTPAELESLRGANHGGLKFELFSHDIKMLTCYRVSISGGLDYCNNQADKMDGEIFTVNIYKRYGTGRGQWTKVAYLQRTDSELFSH
jgi:hypothetical protein